MDFFIYFIIFISKVIENALATLRLIVVANGKKLLGAFLQLVTSIVWVLVTGIVVYDILKDPLKVIFFGLGTFVGSFLGSFIEEKMALGNNLVMTITDVDKGEKVADMLRGNGYAVTLLEGCGMEDIRSVLMIMVRRKKRPHLIKLINKVDKNSMIMSENIVSIQGGQK